MRAKVIIAVFLCMQSLIASTNAQSCVASPYDLSPLTLPSNSVWFYNATYSNGDTFYWNICGTVTNQYCSEEEGTAVCQKSGGSQFSTGNIDQMLLTAGTNSVTVAYKGGDVCVGQSGQPQRSTSIEVKCGSNVDPICSVVGESSCSYSLQMITTFGCSAPSPSPSPTTYIAGINPCNAVKVKSFPSTFQGNLNNGQPYDGLCVEGPSSNSIFYSFTPSSSGTVNATTCGLTSVDTVINVYSSVDCTHLGACFAYNDDDCQALPTATQSTLSVVVQPGKQYFWEVRAFGNSPPGPFAVTFSFYS